MRVIAKSRLQHYWEQHNDCQGALEEWHTIVRRADWKKPSDVIEEIANARFVGNGRFVFKIRGNHYRLIVKIDFSYQRVFIRFIGTHAEYDRIDATDV